MAMSEKYHNSKRKKCNRCWSVSVRYLVSPVIAVRCTTTYPLTKGFLIQRRELTAAPAAVSHRVALTEPFICFFGVLRCRLVKWYLVLTNGTVFPVFWKIICELVISNVMLTMDERIVICSLQKKNWAVTIGDGCYPGFYLTCGSSRRRHSRSVVVQLCMCVASEMNTEVRILNHYLLRSSIILKAYIPLLINVQILIKPVSACLLGLMMLNCPWIKCQISIVNKTCLLGHLKI